MATQHEQRQETGMFGGFFSAIRKAFERLGLREELNGLGTRMERWLEGEEPRRGRREKRVASEVAAKRSRATGRVVDPALSAKKSAAGKKGAAARWGKIPKKGASRKAAPTTGTGRRGRPSKASQQHRAPSQLS
jgi:hypothetical protein